MMLRPAFAAIILLLALGFSSDSQARQIENWPYEKLFKHADLVVVVKPLTVRKAEKTDNARPPDDCDYLTGVVTNFQVLLVVKGQWKDKTMEMVHFRMKEGKVVLNGPLLVAFPTGDKKGRALIAKDCLLFLKKGKDGRLTFVSGQFDPALSVKPS
jgi:hypothetical protein